jgi:glutamyl-tRNA(Gln) amidotransferase subunit E
MPGSARMYPETDVPHIPIDREYLASLKLPETIEERIEKLKALGANDQQCQELLNNGYDKNFEDLARKFHEPKVILRVLNNTIPELEDMGCDPSLITPRVLDEVFNEYKKGNFGKEAISQILRVVCEKRASVGETVESLGLSKVDVKEIKDFIAKLVEENEKTVKERGERSFKVLMGSVMGKYRGRVDGALLSKLLSDKIKEVLNK